MSVQLRVNTTRKDGSELDLTDYLSMLRFTTGFLYSHSWRVFTFSSSVAGWAETEKTTAIRTRIDASGNGRRI